MQSLKVGMLQYKALRGLCPLAHLCWAQQLHVYVVCFHTSMSLYTVYLFKLFSIMKLNTSFTSSLIHTSTPSWMSTDVTKQGNIFIGERKTISTVYNCPLCQIKRNWMWVNFNFYILLPSRMLNEFSILHSFLQPCSRPYQFTLFLLYFIFQVSHPVSAHTQSALSLWTRNSL